MCVPVNMAIRDLLLYNWDSTHLPGWVVVTVLHCSCSIPCPCHQSLTVDILVTAVEYYPHNVT